jgi:hypothetical protein
MEERKQIFRPLFQMSIYHFNNDRLQNNDKNGRYRFRNNQGGAALFNHIMIF